MFYIAFIVLLILKLVGLAALTWVQVFIPLLLAVIFYIGVFVFAFTVAMIKSR